MKLLINGQAREIVAEPDTPLLWVLRDELGLTGTKYGCGVTACGACTVLADGVPVRTCRMPASAFEGKDVTTIEGLSRERSHPVQQAWIDLQVPQCGYCQSGFVMAAAALLQTHRTPTDAQIDQAITNVCRCGTYPAMRAAIHQAAARASNAGAAAQASSADGTARASNTKGASK